MIGDDAWYHHSPRARGLRQDLLVGDVFRWASPLPTRARVATWKTFNGARPEGRE